MVENYPNLEIEMWRASNQDHVPDLYIILHDITELIESEHESDDPNFSITIGDVLGTSLIRIRRVRLRYRILESRHNVPYTGRKDQIVTNEILLEELLHQFFTYSRR